MRGSKTVLIAGVVVTAATATILRAQQMLGGSGAAVSASASGSSDPSMAQRSARQLLRQGLDYLDTYGDYGHALTFLREAQTRPSGLTEAEVKSLANALDRAQQAQSQAVALGADASAPRPRRSTASSRVGGSAAPSAWASSSRRPSRSAGALASAPPVDEPVQRTSGEVATTDPAEPASMDLPALPGASSSQPKPPAEAVAEPPKLDEAPASDAPKAIPAAETGKTASEPIFLTGSSPEEAPKEDPKAPTPAPAAEAPVPAPATAPKAETPVPAPAPVPAPDPLPPLSDPPTRPGTDEGVSLPRGEDPTPAPAPAPAPPPANARVDAGPIGDPPVPSTAPASAPASVADPFATEPPAQAPVAVPVPAPTEAPVGAPRPTSPPRASAPRPSNPTDALRIAGEPGAPATPPAAMTPAPATAAEELPPLPNAGARNSSAPASAAIVAPARSGLSSDSIREVEEIARRQEEKLRQNPPMRLSDVQQQLPIAGGANDSGEISRLELPRAPSPTEPRAIRVIPVPEEFVPLPPREWGPSRKYWASAATCHMPLYFQDAVLERYGQGVEQAAGPAGRFLSYPLDDPRQSNQRNQLIQPMYSAGMFLTQIALLPYNMLMDPPWEAQYDLGFYRPGDKIPADTYYLPKTGIGPPFRGKRY